MAYIQAQITQRQKTKTRKNLICGHWLEIINWLCCFFFFFRKNFALKVDLLKTLLGVYCKLFIVVMLDILSVFKNLLYKSRSFGIEEGKREQMIWKNTLEFLSVKKEMRIDAGIIDMSRLSSVYVSAT